MKIMIFTEGTIIMHKSASNHSREEIVKQVKENDESIHDYSSYIPIGNSVEKLNKWKEQGAEIIYLTSRTKEEDVKSIEDVLKRNGFPEGKLIFREHDKEYYDIVERVIPDVLVEDDCESIGGQEEMCISHVRKDIKEKIKSMPVKEFGGIDHLPDDISELSL